MTTMTGAAAGVTVAGMAIPRVIRKCHGAAGESVAAHAADIATTTVPIRCRRVMMRAGSPDPSLVTTMTTMTIGAAAAAMAAGMGIRKGTPKRHAAPAGNLR